MTSKHASPFASWMTHIHDGTKLSSLIIPGTHDSATGMRVSGIINAATSPIWRCQDRGLLQQLEGGIRFLDMRVCSIKDKLFLAHGVITLPDFHKALRKCRRFLTAHPGECILMSIRMEREPEKSKRNFFEHVLEALSAGFGEDLYRGPATLSDLTLNPSTRGSLIPFFRRVGPRPEPLSVGVDIGRFGSGLHDRGAVPYYVQDDWRCMRWDQKFESFSRCCAFRSEHGRDRDLFIFNYTSNEGIIAGSIGGYPSGIASELNPRILAYLQQGLLAATDFAGMIIAMDFYTDEHVAAIIQANERHFCDGDLLLQQSETIAFPGSRLQPAHRSQPSASSSSHPVPPVDAPSIAILDSTPRAPSPPPSPLSVTPLSELIGDFQSLSLQTDRS